MADSNLLVRVKALDDFSGTFKKCGAEANTLGSKLKGLGKAVAVGGAIAGVAALGATIRQGIMEYTEAAKVGAQTNAVIKSTGGAANVSAADVNKLAESLMKKSGVDDEAIQSGENMLLTFKNIRNEVGKGNDIFDEATKLTLDMSVAMGRDMKDSAIMVGKALNDPIAGVTALRRVGVQLSDQQQQQIKDFMAVGDVMSAQKIILGELNEEFGGSAKAMGDTLPGKINILKESFNNFAGGLIEKVVPKVQKFIDVLVKHMPEIQKIIEDAIGVVIVVFEKLVDVLSWVADHFNTLKPIIVAFFAVWAGYKVIGLATAAIEGAKAVIISLQAALAGSTAAATANATAMAATGTAAAAATPQASAFAAVLASVSNMGGATVIPISKIAPEVIAMGAAFDDFSKKVRGKDGFANVTIREVGTLISGLASKTPEIKDKALEAMTQIYNATKETHPKLAAEFDAMMKSCADKIAALPAKERTVEKMDEIIQAEMSKKPEVLSVMGDIASGLTEQLGGFNGGGSMAGQMAGMRDTIVAWNTPLMEAMGGIIGNLAAMVASHPIRPRVLAPNGLELLGPGYQSGGYVPKKGIYMLHEGEKVVPKRTTKQRESTPSGGGNTYNINLSAGAFAGTPGEARRFASYIQKYLVSEGAR